MWIVTTYVCIVSPEEIILMLLELFKDNTLHFLLGE